MTADPCAPSLLSGWGRTSPSVGHLVGVRDTAHLCELVREAGPRGLLARGLGRSYGDAAQNAGGRVLRPLWADREPGLGADGVVEVAAGVSLARLAAYTVPRGFDLPVLPGTGQVTVGGALAADVHGKNHSAGGSIGRWVRWLDLVDGAGTLRRLSPEQRPELFWATLGGMGLTGVITRAALQLEPVASAAMQVTTSRFEDFEALLAALSAPGGEPYRVAWVDCLAHGRHRYRSVLDTATRADDPSGGFDPAGYRPRRPLPTTGLPLNPLRPATVAAFNALWWSRAPRTPRTRRLRRDAFFHQLDAVAGWNRLYGPRGLLQYQFCVPDSAAALLSRVIDTLADAGLAPFLAVLKRYGDADPGPLSFPQPGWSLAVDLAVLERAAPVLDRLDEMVAGAGGRVYLAKDSRLRPDLLAAMYPQLSRWRRQRDELDPEHRFVSDLARRLGV